ncbi:hypothetical protein U1737_09920 [Sphingomonas sp. LB3N6]|uniref:hypothetical protein n=1 Tax=Sphingomonas fucosidasi TaxID=3096164 RepID=UPI002FC6A3CA
MSNEPAKTVKDLKTQLEYARSFADNLSLPMVAVYIEHAITNLEAAEKFNKRHGGN